MYRQILAVCLILTLPTALIARPFLNGQSSLYNKNRATQQVMSLQEKIMEELLHQLTSQEQSNEDDIITELESEEEEEEEENDLDAGLFEGDIALTPEDIAEMYGLETGAEIQKMSSSTKKWPDGKVYYSFDEDFPEKGRKAVLAAIQEYHDMTCLTFHETMEGNRINITHRGSGCWSFVGRLNKVQQLNLGKGCYSKGTAIHEIGHAMGFNHEQSRPDRDRYVLINCENIKKGKDGNFNLKKHINYQDEPYNFGSIMHYGSKAFSKNKQPTITIRDEELYELENRPDIGAKKDLSNIDVAQINKQYGCYVPNSSPGVLHVRVLQAGPFSDPAHYYVCVTARDSEKNTVTSCNNEDPISTTDPEWDTMFIFEPTFPDMEFYSFDVEIKKVKTKGKNPTILPSQTIWVESLQHDGKYYTNKEQSVLYEYKIIE